MSAPYIVALDLKVARRVRLHQIIKPDGTVLASERTIAALLDRLYELHAEGHTVRTDDDRYWITVAKADELPLTKGTTPHGKD